MKVKIKVDRKRPRSDLEYALWRLIGSYAGGKLDTTISGTEHSNGKGATRFYYCKMATYALLGVYPGWYKIYEWVRVESPKWEALAKAIYNVGSFLKI